ncbi:MAG: hypothetical protein HC818_00780, partial [Synechococcaceae cyanobacterium RM1_1_27]|nr:hypothetical protein [Synechococcaceae cyanobacterium RM1_1_27]
WDPQQALPLQTSSSDYPLWWVDVEGLGEGESRIEYQYLRRSAQGTVWELWGPTAGSLLKKHIILAGLWW